jgi:hypothetical protein
MEITLNMDWFICPTFCNAVSALRLYSDKWQSNWKIGMWMEVGVARSRCNSYIFRTERRNCPKY